MPLHMRNHDAFFPRALSYLRLGEKKKALFTKEDGWRTGGAGVPGIPRYTVDTLL